MTAYNTPAYATDAARVDWVDYAKGFCIVFVVMMHSTLGVEAAAGETGWMHWLVAFAQPFRMPDFFLISGLFLARVIDRDWRTYLDRKVVHFLYFYLLWIAIQFAFKAPGIAAEHGAGGAAWALVETIWEPFGTLWFIYLLPVFFVVTKMLREARVPRLAIFLFAAALEIAPIHTGSIVIDEFASRFVYFYAGYVAAPHIFALANWVIARPLVAVGGLVIWATMNGLLVFSGFAHLPLASLALGFAGAAAVVAASALMSRSRAFSPLRFAGQHSLVVYLAFFLPMAVTRTVLLKTGITGIGTISLIVTAAGVIAPLLLFLAVRHTRLGFLFERPDWAKLRPARPTVMQPAE